MSLLARSSIGCLIFYSTVGNDDYGCYTKFRKVIELETMIITTPIGNYLYLLPYSSRSSPSWQTRVFCFPLSGRTKYRTRFWEKEEEAASRDVTCCSKHTSNIYCTIPRFGGSMDAGFYFSSLLLETALPHCLCSGIWKGTNDDGRMSAALVLAPVCPHLLPLFHGNHL